MKAALDQNVPISFAPTVKYPVFGGPPAFVSISDQPLKTSLSIFGHLSFGSNLPTFKRLSDRIALISTSNKTTAKRTLIDFELLRVNRTASTPDVLKAVGLCKTPKTYAKKSLITTDIDRCDTTNEMFFCTNADFGHIDFEQNQL